MNPADFPLPVDENRGGVTGEVIQLRQRTGDALFAHLTAEEDRIACVVPLFQLRDRFFRIVEIIFPLEGDTDHFHAPLPVLFIPRCKKGHLIQTVGTPAAEDGDDHHLVAKAFIAQ